MNLSILYCHSTFFDAPRYIGISVRTSAPSFANHVGGWGLPGSVISSSGQGFGLRMQKVMNSRACSIGRMTRLACTNPGQQPAVVPVWRPPRIFWRNAAGVSIAFGVCIIIHSLSHITRSVIQACRSLCVAVARAQLVKLRQAHAIYGQKGKMS